MCPCFLFPKLRFITSAWIALWLPLATANAASFSNPSKPANLVVNPGFGQEANHKPVGYDLTGNASLVYGGITGMPGANETSGNAVALDSGKGADADGKRDASVSQDVLVQAAEARWYRFSFRGLPQADYLADSLKMKVDFFDKNSPLDGVVKDLMPDIEKDRLDIASNGVGKQGGAAVWRNYILEFKLPFPSISRLKLSVNSTGGKGDGAEAAFWVDDVSLVVLPNPPDSKVTAKANQAPPPDEKLLVAMGGRWYYLPQFGEGRPREITAANANRLYYKAGRWETPFAESMTATLKAGWQDAKGKLVDADQEVPDNVTLRFETNALVVHAKNLPNHPTAQFPGYLHNPNYIKEQDFTYYLPFNPKPNPNAIAMDEKNTNRALNMGSVGIAVNGVVFYNPFDAGNSEAVDIMDRCCGHPDPGSRYHYHKYPVCVRSPFQDEGKEHSPVIGFAFDGLPVYGPYEADGEMAKDSKTNPLNTFNAHQDADRGWHYHVTPGKFPYIVGGYFAEMEPRNRGKRGGGPGGPGGGPPGGGGPGQGPGPGGPPPPGGGGGRPPFPPPGFPPPRR